jgi:phosphoglycolate phosphatase-like HAD superfamily hydrolase
MMATDVRKLTKQAVDELPEDEAAEVLDFISYLRWRREEMDQSWFWTEEWQEHYREAKADLAEGQFRDFDDVEDLLAELKSTQGKST